MLEELVKLEAKAIWEGWKLNCLIREAQQTDNSGTVK